MWSMSKSYGMAGWRIGFVVGNAEIVERSTCSATTRVSACSPRSSTRRRAALEGPEDERRGAPGALRAPPRPASSRRCPSRRSARAASTSGYGCRTGLSVETLLRDHRVALAPGDGFGPSGTGYARVSLAVSDEMLERRDRASRARARGGVRVKIGIIVPFSWSYWGGVVEHAENQAARPASPRARRARSSWATILPGT